jgi:hypothetical protein
MRAVADELGRSTMAIYRYVDSREELERLVVDLVLVGVELHASPRAAWTTRVTRLAEGARAAIADHPGVAPLMLVHRHASTQSRRWGEATMAALDAGGFGGQARAIAFRTLLSYVFGAALVEHLGPLSGPGTATLAALDPTEHPHLADTARHARAIPPDVEFRKGLEIVLRGLGDPRTKAQ